MGADNDSNDNAANASALMTSDDAPTSARAATPATAPVAHSNTREASDFRLRPGAFVGYGKEEEEGKVYEFDVSVVVITSPRPSMNDKS